MKASTKVLSLEQIHFLFKKWAKFPSGSICKHLVMIDILNELERTGISTMLVTPCVNADDEKILEMLKDVPDKRYKW